MNSETLLEVTIYSAEEALELYTDFVNQRFAESVEFVEHPNPSLRGVRFYLPHKSARIFESELAEFAKSTFDVKAPEITTRTVSETDWVEKFRQSIKPEIIDGTILVRPTWAEVSDEERAGVTVEIILDPKMAFGTGSHETTRLCMIALKNNVRPGMSALDVGCGSGILSILAAKLGAASTLAIDIDPLAVENTEENCKLNDVEELVEIRRGSTDTCSLEGKFDIVVANIISSGLIPLAPELVGALRPGGTLILSGLLQDDSELIESALNNAGVKDWIVSYDGEWRSYVSHKSAEI